jgi:hypothetical protein
MSTRPRLASDGQLKNLSRSGAFIATSELQLFSLVHVYFESLGRPKQAEDTIAAYVTRISDEGVGIEWCEFAPPRVSELLQMTMATSDALMARDVEVAPPEIPADVLLSNNLS